MYDCVIVGAGPAGSYTAQKLAEFGFRVLIFEEHKEVGFPLHCAGIVGEDVVRTYQVPDDCILRRINSVAVHFPSGETMVIPTHIKPYIIDRAIFDRLIFQRAVNEGADFRTSSRVEKIETGKKSVKIYYKNCGKSGFVESKLCVIAAGAMSSLPISAGFEIARSSYQAVQMEVEADGGEGMELYLGNSIAPGSFAYMISIGRGRSRIGLITRRRAANYYRSFIDSDFLKNKIKAIIRPPVFRRMPFGMVKKSVSGRTMIVGDSASQLKTTTGGGVNYGMKCASILAHTIRRAHRNGDFSPGLLKRYDGRWKKELGLELIAGMLLRRFLENVSDDWWNRMPRVLESGEVRHLIEEYDDFDHHYRFIMHFFRKPITREFLLELLKFNFLPAGKAQSVKNYSEGKNYSGIKDKVMGASSMLSFLSGGIT